MIVNAMKALALRGLELAEPLARRAAWWRYAITWYWYRELDARRFSKIMPRKKALNFATALLVIDGNAHPRSLRP